jgi:hypothetical protein
MVGGGWDLVIRFRFLVIGLSAKAKSKLLAPFRFRLENTVAFASLKASRHKIV